MSEKLVWDGMKVGKDSRIEDKVVKRKKEAYFVCGLFGEKVNNNHKLVWNSFVKVVAFIIVYVCSKQDDAV